MRLIILTIILSVATVSAQDKDPIEDAGMGALGGALIGFVGSGYVGSIFGGLSQAAYIYEQQKTTCPPGKGLTNFKGPYPSAYRLSKYKVLNPYDGKEVWVGNKPDGMYFRDTEGRLFIIDSIKK